MKTLKFRSAILFFFLLGHVSLHGKTYDADYGAEIRKDRETLFFRICVDAYKEVEKRGARLLCPSYARSVVGEDFSSIFNSMQREFHNIARRNRHLPRVVLTEKRTKRELEKLLEDRDPKYKDIFFPGTLANSANNKPTDVSDTASTIRSIISVNVIDLSENERRDRTLPTDISSNTSNVSNLDLDQNEVDESSNVIVTPYDPSGAISEVDSQNDSQDNSQADSSVITNSTPIVTMPVTTAVIEGTEKTEDVEETKEAVEVKDTSLSKDQVIAIYNESLLEGLSKYCIAIYKKQGKRIGKNEIQYCKDFGGKLKDKSIDDIIAAFKNDPTLKTDVEEELIKKLIIVVAIRNGHPEKDISEFVNQGAKIAVDGPAEKPAEVIAEAQPEKESEGGATRNPAVVSDIPVVVDPSVEDSVREAYSSILASEIQKLCPSNEAKCVEAVTARVNEQRDNALDNLKVRDVASVEETPVPVVGPVASVVIGAESEVSCDDLVQNGIRELLEKDEGNILGKQFQLTSLKMALQIMEKRSKKTIDNVEEYIKKDQANLIASDNKKVMDDLIKFYRDHGKHKDESFISDTFNKVSSSNYFKSSTRIYNDSASVLILADSLTNENSRFSEVDAASVWFASEINKNFKEGSYHNNLTNLSSLTFRVLGRLKNEKPPINIDRLKASIDKIEADLNGNYEIMRKEIGEKFADCFKGEYASCNSRPAFDKNFAKSLMEMTAKIKNNEGFTLEIDRSLKGSINQTFKFDFLPGQYK